MYDDRPGIPIATFITFRPYATWLHGDERGAIDRSNNRYGEPRIEPSHEWLAHEQKLRKQRPVSLDAAKRDATRRAILGVCEHRNLYLHALNIRTSHVHSVVSGADLPSRILIAFKANATRLMRESGAWTHVESPWARGGIKRYIWTEAELGRVIDYVLNRQGEPSD